jgi:hypothetical protein
MARKYSRDNRGRFASGGGGATARGGRLKTAAGNKRKTQTMQAGGAKAAGTIKGKVKRDPGAAGKAGKGKASVATAAKKRIAVTTFKTNTDLGRRGVVSMSARAKVRRSQNVKSLATEKGKGVLERIQGAGARRGIRETKYNAPGSAGAKRIAKTAATQSRAKAFAQQQVYSKGGGAYRGQRPEFNWKRSRAKLNRRTVAKSAPSAAVKSSKKKSRVDDSKVSRVISRVNNVVRGSEQKTGVKRLNAIQVGARAKSFLARKEGGNIGIINQKSQPEAFSSVRKAMTKPPKYSTQKPNRNKPGRFNDLGQDKARAKAKAETMTARERIAKAKERKSKIPNSAMSRRSLPQIGAPRAPGYAKGTRQAGTVARPKARAALTAAVVARTRSQAKAAQRNRREQILNRGRTGFTGLSSLRRNPRIKRSDTGMRQLSLTGKAKTLFKFKPVKRR